MPIPPARDALAIARQFRKGAWTNDPNDATYANHWHTLRDPNEPIESVLPGVGRADGGWLGRSPKQMVNVVTTPTHVYIDTPNIERVGPLARVLASALESSRGSTPQALPRSDVAINPGRRQNQVVLSAPRIAPIIARQDAFVGKPSDLSGKDQLKNLWGLLRG